MSQILKLSYTKLQEKHPSLTHQLRAGLLLAIAGRVKRDGQYWQVFSQEAKKRAPYHVTTGEIISWHCNCDYSQNKPMTPVDDFGGYRALVVCKHIAAVALCMDANVYPPAPARTWDLLNNLIAAQHVPAPGETWQIPGKAIKLINKNRDGRDVLMLATGRAYSLPLAAWVSNQQLPGRGMWIMKETARAHYVKFVEEIGGTVAPEEGAEQMSIAAASGDTEFEWGGKDSYG